MLKGWGRAVVRLRWSVLAAGLVIALTGVGWGSGVFASLTSGGFDDPDSESMQAAERIAAELGDRDVDLVVLYSSETATVDDQGFRESVTSTIEGLRDRPEVASAVSYYDTQAPAMVSTDEHATYAAINLSATDDNDKRADYDALAPALAAPGLTTEVGGLVAFQATTDELTERDIVRGEMLAMPLC
jgi:RND superfamily putative drug exporter